MRNQRARTASISSTYNHSTPDSYGHEPPKVVPSTLPDYSQVGLEKVLKGRLVETFLAIHVIPTSEDTEIPPSEHGHSRSSSLSQPATPTSHITPAKSPLRMTGANSFSSVDPKLPSSPTTSEGSFRHTSSGPSRVSKSHHKSAPSIQSQLSLSKSVGASTSRVAGDCTIPDYLSSIHRPSTSPTFLLDPRTEFAPGTDISGHDLKVEIWAKMGGGADERKKPVEADGNGKGKGKEKELSQVQDSEWQVLERWTVDLLEVVPLSDDPNATLHLPSNTLILTLDSRGQRYYVPPPKRNIVLSRSRSPSPTGYASDPETDARKVKDSNEPAPLVLPSRQRRRTRQHTEDNAVKTASWQDLFTLVSLQACIADTEASLATIVEGFDAVIADDGVSVLRREISEREFRITELKESYIMVNKSSQRVRDDMRVRREELKHRREMLRVARQQEEELVHEREEVEEEVIDERQAFLS
ncbi:hypothetical protein AAF712_013581 [Marasmius tenuissimus]|uniref:Uncharacterized protein n=1 Tax=Marasmius tenuissimus TaxID=585030 RepID=A0ABR2ZEB5_9AGAR